MVNAMAQRITGRRRRWRRPDGVDGGVGGEDGEAWTALGHARLDGDVVAHDLGSGEGDGSVARSDKRGRKRSGDFEHGLSGQRYRDGAAAIGMSTRLCNRVMVVAN
jgi:hypothetical protein